MLPGVTFLLHRRGLAVGRKLAALESKLGQGVLIGLVGGCGTGKTQMAVELMKAATLAGRQAQFRTAVELLVRIKSSYRPDSGESDLSVIRAHRCPSLMVIDELGRRRGAQWEDTMFFQLLAGGELYLGSRLSLP